MALAGLAADYSCSSSENGEEEPNNVLRNKEDDAEQFSHNTDSISNVDVVDISPDSYSSRCNFFTDDPEHQDSTDADNSDTDEQEQEIQQNTASRLPNPLAAPDSLLSGQQITSSTQEGSVFGNRYAAQEHAKQLILEKHVKMTEDKFSSQAKCFKFKKGLCSRGAKCRFSHDLGFQAPVTHARPADDEYIVDSQSEIPNGQSHRTKRAGVTNTLYPAKKAKKGLDTQRAADAPWTVPKDGV